MSKDKYASIYLRQMRTIVFTTLQILFTTVFIIGEYHPDIPQYSLTRLDQKYLMDYNRKSTHPA